MGLNGIFVMCDTLTSHGWWIFNEMFSLCAAAFVSRKLIFGWKETSKKMCKWKEREHLLCQIRRSAETKRKASANQRENLLLWLRYVFGGSGNNSSNSVLRQPSKARECHDSAQKTLNIGKSKDEEEKWNSNHRFMCWTVLNLQRGGGCGGGDGGECAWKCSNICTKHT